MVLLLCFLTVWYILSIDWDRFQSARTKSLDFMATACCCCVFWPYDIFCLDFHKNCMLLLLLCFLTVWYILSIDWDRFQSARTKSLDFIATACCCCCVKVGLHQCYFSYGFPVSVIVVIYQLPFQLQLCNFLFFSFNYSCDFSVTVTVIVFQFLFLFQLVILHKCMNVKHKITSQYTCITVLMNLKY